MLPDGLGSKLGEQLLPPADFRGEGIAAAVNGALDQLREIGNVLIRQVRLHDPDMGSGSAVAKAEAGLPIMVPLMVEMIASPLAISGKAEYSASPNARQPCA